MWAQVGTLWATSGYKTSLFQASYFCLLSLSLSIFFLLFLFPIRRSIVGQEKFSSDGWVAVCITHLSVATNSFAGEWLLPEQHPELWCISQCRQPVATLCSLKGSRNTMGNLGHHLQVEPMPLPGPRTITLGFVMHMEMLSLVKVMAAAGIIKSWGIRPKPGCCRHCCFLNATLKLPNPGDGLCPLPLSPFL